MERRKRENTVIGEGAGLRRKRERRGKIERN